MPKPRKKATKAVLPVMHIFCEGEKTEPNYIKGYLDNFHPGNKRLKVVQVEKTKKNTPVQLVDEAINKKSDRDTPKNDDFWVIYDSESEAKYKNELHQKAFDRANSKNINVVINNVCFEIWILLHFVDSSASYSSYDDLLNSSNLKNELKKHGVEKYEKANAKIFSTLIPYINDACARAKKMNTHTIDSAHCDTRKPFLLNPYTNMYEILEAIDNFIKTK